jgi:eukaryotic-like serine/threonine-protein kinase
MAHSAKQFAHSRIGSYEIISQLAAGAMGVVYKAYDTKLQRTVALKFLSPAQPSTAFDQQYVLREARAASALDHKYIAQVHSVEQTDTGQLFIVMPCYDGETLAARMERQPLSQEEALRIVHQVAEGLQYAHAHGVVHRDIKPSNIMLTADVEPRIVDFGLARLLGSDASTHSLSLAGTLPYMSPEQLSGRDVDARTDIWSLGVVMYELLARRLPFTGDSASSAIAAILRSSPSDMSDLAPELQFIISRAICKHLEKRYRDCTELLHDLDTLESSARVPALTPDQRHFGRRVKLASIARSARSIIRTRAARWYIIIGLLLLVAVLDPPLEKFGRTGSAIPSPARSSASTAKTTPAAFDLYLQAVEKLERYDKRENLGAAVTLLQNATASDPRFALAYAGLCEAFWDKYRLDQDPSLIQQASSYCKQAAELNSELPAVHVALGRIHEGMGQHDLALADYQHAFQLDPRSSKALLGMGEVYQSLGRTTEAESSIRQGITLRPDYWDGYQRLGYFYYRERRYSEAAEQYRHVIELVPDNANAHANLGVMLTMLGNDADAEKELKRSLELAPNWNTYSALGTIYYRHNRFAEAAAMHEHAVKLNDKDYQVWNNLALAYEWLGQKEKALHAYDEQRRRLEEVVRLRPEDAGIRAQLGLAYSKLHDRKKAIPHLQSAIALSPHDPEVLTNVGEAYENLGDRATALLHIKSALDYGDTLDQLQQNPSLRDFLADPRVKTELASRLSAQSSARK